MPFSVVSAVRPLRGTARAQTRPTLEFVPRSTARTAKETP